ncbi:MAG: diguanylate cyclase [Clostridia bacterium]
MEKADLDIILKQINTIILAKPIPNDLRVKSDELSELQNSILYLSSCFSECNEFVGDLSAGNLDVVAPNRHNFLAANLKELHIGLRHLTWQANQVANGDYNQKVTFLGAFSDSFNRMITQLKERENKLLAQSKALKNSVDVLIEIVDKLSAFVVVTEKSSRVIIYTNRSAKDHFYNNESNKHICGSTKCDLMRHLTSYDYSEYEVKYEFSCPINGKTLSARTYPIQWDEKDAFVHFITDITEEKKDKNRLENFAYNDELTELYNRRYCINELTDLLNDKKDFAVCLLDLDALKNVNDTFGHAVGDEYITTVTKELKAFQTKEIVMCRIGGDEFLIIFKNPIDDIVNSTIDLINEKISAYEREYKMSFSFGTYFVASDANILPETVLSKVDKIMYKAKKEKRGN